MSGESGDTTAEVLSASLRRHSTATVLFHHAVAERLGLGPADHKCLDLVLERGPMTGSELARITGLTSGAITGVVARLEAAGFLRREPDPQDRRKQLLHCTEQARQRIGEVFSELVDFSTLLADFDADQLATVARFLDRATEVALRQVALLRAIR